MDMVWYFVGAGVCVIVYAIIANRMLQLGHVLRQRVLGLSETLLADERIPQSVKAEIYGVVPHLAEVKAAWLIVFAALPAAFSSLHDIKEPPIPSDRMTTWRDLQRFSIAAALTNSPAAAFLFALQVVVFTYFVTFNLLADVVLIRVVGSFASQKRPWGGIGLKGA